MKKNKLNEDVREFWEMGPCGTGSSIVSDVEPFTLEWYERIEKYRYEVEPCIHSVAQFSRYNGKKVLEVGVGAGTDHLQWARVGADCYGVDLTDAAIEATYSRFKVYGFETKLQRLDAEILPFDENVFDVVYSWGVIHHTENPQILINEIKRVLKPGGIFIGMIYGRHSPLAFKFWVKHALFKGKLWLNFADIIWDKVESIGTKSYTKNEVIDLFKSFNAVKIQPIITKYDRDDYPKWLSKFFPEDWGWFIGITASK